ncbi:hypothetical protein CPB86DRAFT_248474 [Serendipita vermifera]|nr:hypothetical protein CPB86DRAFT_248474 [Serendipita vermifera]
MSKIETLNVRWSRVHGDDLGRLLQLPRAIKTFTYQDLGLSIPYKPKLLVHTFHQALNLVSGTLESLTVYWPEDELDDTSAYWSLHNFASLKRLSISFPLMAGVVPAVAPNIADLLPPALEALEFFYRRSGRWTPEELCDHIKRLLLQKSNTVLNRLCRVEFRHNASLLLPLAELASQKGVSVGQSPLA